MNESRIEESRFAETDLSYALSLVSGRLKPAILYCLAAFEPVRFNEMQRYLGMPADKSLSASLKELERDGLVIRKMYPELPPKVEYSLADRGRSLAEALAPLGAWGAGNRE